MISHTYYFSVCALIFIQSSLSTPQLKLWGGWGSQKSLPYKYICIVKAVFKDIHQTEKTKSNFPEFYLFSPPFPKRRDLLTKRTLYFLTTPINPPRSGLFPKIYSI